MTASIKNAFRNLNILVAGDLLLDRYLAGSVRRICPEAPIPIVQGESSILRPGGAANTAINLAALGANVTFTGACGKDPDGDAAMRLLQDAGVQTEMLQSEHRSTIVKTRIMADGRLIARCDTGTETSLTEEEEARVLRRLRTRKQAFHAVLLSDYRKGFLTDTIMRGLGRIRRQQNAFLAIDSKCLSKFSALKPDLVKPNYQEAIQLLGLPAIDQDRKQQMTGRGSDLHQITGARIIALTLDTEGAIVFQNGIAEHSEPAYNVPDANVIGAGDAYISAFTLSVLQRSSLQEAAGIAAAAATVAIRKKTTAFCTNQELCSFLSTTSKHIQASDDLSELCSLYRSQGKKIVFTNGCFDILHSGHVTFLKNARALGDVLIVGINTDDSVKRMKGPTRPINALNDRSEVLSGLEAVTHIIPFGRPGADVPNELIERIRPHIFVKGGDYTMEKLPEAPLVNQLGGEVVLLPLLPGCSTTATIHKIHARPMLKTV